MMHWHICETEIFGQCFKFCTPGPARAAAPTVTQQIDPAILSCTQPEVTVNERFYDPAGPGPALGRRYTNVSHYDPDAETPALFYKKYVLRQDVRTPAVAEPELALAALAGPQTYPIHWQTQTFKSIRKVKRHQPEYLGSTRDISNFGELCPALRVYYSGSTTRIQRY
eukprot:3106642-Rhodomonas_salina.1